MNTILRISLAILLLASPAWASSRLAIVADTQSQPVADLLVAGLSKQQGVELVEREEIDKVMREHQLSVNGNLEQELDLSKLLRAQGILVLEVTKKDDQSPAVLHARLAAVEPGVVIFDMDAPLAKDNAEGLSKLVSDRILPLLPKLQVAGGKAVPISILNVRAVDTSVEPLEREVTMLLASRLASEPAVFVLERRRLDLLAGEKTYGAETPGAFWNGAYLLDGNIESDGKNDGMISIHLRLRKPGGGDGETISAEGPATSAKELVEKLAPQILKTVGQESTAPQWDPAAEAAQYLDEAIWAKNQAQYQAALEAAESASSLGLNSPDVYFIRTWLYAHKASSREDLEEADHSYIEAYRTPAPLKERYDAAMKAIELCEVYLDGKLYEKLTRFDLRTELEPRNNKISQNVVRKSSEILVELTGQPDSADMPREPLRQAIRKVAHFDPAAGIFPGDIDETEQFVRYWVNDPDELVSYYCLQTHADEPWQKEVTMAHLYHLLQGREAVFDGFPDPKGLFARLLKMMAADPRAQLNAYFLMSAGTGPREERAAAYAKFLDLYWAQRDTLMKDQIFDSYISMLYHLDQDMLAAFPRSTSVCSAITWSRPAGNSIKGFSRLYGNRKHSRPTRPPISGTNFSRLKNAARKIPTRVTPWAGRIARSNSAMRSRTSRRSSPLPWKPSRSWSRVSGSPTRHPAPAKIPSIPTPKTSAGRGTSSGSPTNSTWGLTIFSSPSISIPSRPITCRSRATPCGSWSSPTSFT